MNTYKLILRYNGYHYKGWQIQTSPVKTVQGELNKALRKITKSEEVKSIGSGRTDAGVHALGQVVRIEIPIEIEADSLTRAINSNLPKDIEVLKAQKCSESFHPVREAISKEYRYYFKASRDLGPFVNTMISASPSGLDYELMVQACDKFVGEHDFQNYFCTGTEISSTTRTIFRCEIKRINALGLFSDLCGDYFEIRVIGSGFLKQMVRLMIAAIWAVGLGRKTLKDLEESLNEAVLDKLGATAPPEGLYLYSVDY